MTARTAQIVEQTNRIKSLLSAAEGAKDQIIYLLLAEMRTPERVSMGIVAADQVSGMKRRLTSTLLTAEHLDAPEKILQRPEGIVDLYTIEWLLRPALLLKSGIFEKQQQGLWAALEPGFIASSAASVCRIDHAYFGHIGTGFIAGEEPDHHVILTNAHVIEGALTCRWLKDKQAVLTCAFNYESGNDDVAYAELAPKYELHDAYDLGLLYLPKKDQADTPEVLRIAGALNASVDHLQIGLVGHPSFNSDKDPFPKVFGFGDQFGVKRFSPGYVRQMERREWRNAQKEVLLHDATTLSGSSGSCILDTLTKKVVGLHFGGWPNQPKSMRVHDRDILATTFEANGAVPLWVLAEDDMLKKLNFS
ncbi:MAG: Glutamate synthase large chain [Mucilaginibacter sp.]|nr:Glutamate synthase large chain [Mucilaginibacter sp.]